jgi:hypothetical protein
MRIFGLFEAAILGIPFYFLWNYFAPIYWLWGLVATSGWVLEEGVAFLILLCFTGSALVCPSVRIDAVGASSCRTRGHPGRESKVI